MLTKLVEDHGSQNFIFSDMAWLLPAAMVCLLVGTRADIQVYTSGQGLTRERRTKEGRICYTRICLKIRAGHATTWLRQRDHVLRPIFFFLIRVL